MKHRKNRWTGVDKKARRSYILARHRLTFVQWCTVVQARINMANANLNKKILKSKVPKKLRDLPVIPNQDHRVPKTAGFFNRLVNWFKELFTPAKALPVSN